MSRSVGGPMPVPRQEWPLVSPPALGAWSPRQTVSVILPARDCQSELDLTLAGLSEQTYPGELYDVVVVDDASAMELRLPEVHPPHCRILRLESAQEHGSGRARHAGALVADGEIVLFLDADIVPTRTHIEAHARWHAVLSDAVVLGRKLFVDFAGVTAADVRNATRDDAFESLLAGRNHKRHTWLENFILQSANLTQYAEDTFLAVVGASVSTPRDLYLESGGFASFGLRGIVDTEFGYRIFTAGGVLLPEPQASSYHQGDRSFAVRGDVIKRERSGIAANYLPLSLFRPTNTGRIWAVPMVRAVVDARSGRAEEVQVTVDSLLAQSFTDLAVTISPPRHAIPQWLLDYFAADARVIFANHEVTSGFPSPFTFVVPAGVVMTPHSLDELMGASAGGDVGVVRTTVPDLPGPSVELWATRALHRARRHQGRGDLESAARRLFGETWYSGASLGVRRAVIGVTRQGMLVDEQAKRPVSQ